MMDFTCSVLLGRRNLGAKWAIDPTSAHPPIFSDFSTALNVHRRRLTKLNNHALLKVIHRKFFKH